MSRRSQAAAEQAAQQASEAGRILQAQRGREEQSPEPQSEPSEKPEGVRPAPRNEPRRLAMEEIEQRHERTMTGTPIEQPADPVPPTPEERLAAQHAVQPKQPEQVEEAPKVEAPETQAAVEPVAEAVRVKVDGEVFDVPKAEVDEAGGLVAYQKIRAAENRVSKLNESIAQTRQEQAKMLQWMQQFAQPQQPKPNLSQMIQASMDAIRYGSPEEGTTALNNILEAAVSQNRVDPNAIEQRALLKFSMMTAAGKFREEFADVMANPMMATLAAVEEQKRLSSLQSIPTDWNAFYRSIGNELRALVGPKPYQQETKPANPTADPTSQQQPSNTSPAPSAKEARKASIVNLPTAANRAELPKESKPETRDDVLNGMRKSRGIPTG